MAGLVRLPKVSIALDMLRFFFFLLRDRVLVQQKNNGDYLKRDSVGRLGKHAGLCHEV